MIIVQEVLRLYWCKQYVFEFNTGIHYIDIQTIHIEDLKESLGLILFISSGSCTVLPYA